MIDIARNGRGARVANRTLGLGLALSMVAPGLVAGCGGSQQAAAPSAPPMGNYRPPSQTRVQPQRQGMSTKKKVLLIGGAALAYYPWKKHRNAQNQPLPQGVQLYQSKNGGIYYRDARNPQVPIYVVPPTKGPQGQPFNTQLQVDPSEVQGLGLDQYQGYDGSTGGNGLDSVLQKLPSR